MIFRKANAFCFWPPLFASRPFSHFQYSRPGSSAETLHTALCLHANSLCFVFVKKFGQPLVDRFFPLHKQHKLRFLNDHSRLDRIVFLLYLLPAMPKDVVTYLAALTPLTLRRYLLLTMTARIPSVLCATFASDAIMEGNYVSAVVVFCISGTLGILCMSFSRQIIAWMKRLKKH